MSRAAIINVVGLTARHLSEENTPQIMAWLKHKQIAPVQPVLPAVTTTMQATYLTARDCGERVVSPGAGGGADVEAEQPPCERG